MPFNPVPANVDYVAQEKEVLRFWEESQAFEHLRELQQGKPAWSFIDGPITANNPMGVHHGWGRTYKDLFGRFWAMQGRELRYQNGFVDEGSIERGRRDLASHDTQRIVAGKNLPIGNAIGNEFSVFHPSIYGYFASRNTGF